MLLVRLVLVLLHTLVRTGVINLTAKNGMHTEGVLGLLVIRVLFLITSTECQHVLDKHDAQLLLLLVLDPQTNLLARHKTIVTEALVRGIHLMTVLYSMKVPVALHLDVHKTIHLARHLTITILGVLVNLGVLHHRERIALPTMEQTSELARQFRDVTGTLVTILVT